MSLNEGTALPSSADDLNARPEEPAPAAGTGAPEKQKTNWWRELRAIAWLILAVLAFHSLIAKPFYIPSESMMPGLLKGDRLVVSKYPYGWSWVSPSFHILPRSEGRLFGSLPERGDVVIASHPGDGTDYIKRVIGLPGDRFEIVGGQVIINGQPIRREQRGDAEFAIDLNLECPRERQVRNGEGAMVCRLPIVRETLPNGRAYDTIDLGYYREADDFAEIVIPDGRVFLMGDNRDQSADSRFPLYDVLGNRQGLDGPVPWENIGGRAEFITFSLDGSSSYWNPISWFTALRAGRAGTSLAPEEGAAGQ